jgi:hypothetical protein
MFTAALSLTLLAMAAPQTFVLESSDPMWDMAMEDFNGDGMDDIAILTAAERTHPLKKSVLIYLAQEGASFATEPSYTLALPPDSGAYFLAEVNGAPPKEFVAGNAAGAEVYTFEAASGLKSFVTARFDSLMPSGTREPSFLKGAAEDLDGDNRDEWIVPIPSGYAVRHVDRELARIACDVNSEIYRTGSVYIRHRLPDILSFEGAGTKPRGLAFLSDGPDWKERTRFQIPLNVEEKWDASARMADINMDGFPDLVVVQTRGTINLEAITQIYVATGPFQYPAEPTARFQSKGAVEAPLMIDVDGDGDKDALVVSIPFGAKNIVNYFVRGKISADALVYAFDNGTFSKEPVYSKSLTLTAPEGRERISYELADINGDNRLDLAVSDGPNQLDIHTGEEKGFLSDKPAYEINIPAFGIAKAHDIKRDGSKDLVLIHPASENSRRAEVVIF